MLYAYLVAQSPFTMAIVQQAVTIALITPEQIATLDKYDQVRKKLHEILAGFAAHTLWVLGYYLLLTLPNPLNPVPSKTGPPLHVTIIITILILRDVAKVIYGVRRLLTLRHAIMSAGMQSRRLSLPAYREAVLNGFVQGFLASALGEALAQAGDGNAV